MPPSEKTVKDFGEFGLIAQIAAMNKIRRGTIKSIGDDAAVIASQKDQVLLLTTDMLAEGVHFTKDMGARAIGRKAMACSISDIAAMGGMPLAAVISVGMPPQTKASFIKELYRGMEQWARRFHFSIAGGDTILNRSLVINVALLGTAEKENIVYRSGARIGDMIFTTGFLGCSFQTRKHLTFTPRIRESQYLLKHFKLTSMIDISDGLAGDLGHILKESRTGAVIYEKRIPKTPGAALQNALYDGEDFELLFTLAPNAGRRLLFAKGLPFRFFYIGDIVGKKDGLVLINTKGRKVKIKTRGFTHF